MRLRPLLFKFMLGLLVVEFMWGVEVGRPPLLFWLLLGITGFDVGYYGVFTMHEAFNGPQSS